jgi:magnesium chelatase family protein
MLARRLPGILPPPDEEERLEIATIASAAGTPPPARLSQVQRPFRAPHHTASHAALIGGGSPIRPGEVTLAHGGVLFLDELPELNRPALEALRPTMESGQACVVRARDRVVMPARPLIVAAMNPCPCGYEGHPRRICRCTPDQIDRYRARVSGPLLDRFDLHVALPPVSVKEVERGVEGEGSAVVRARVLTARAFRAYRLAGRVPDLTQAPLVRAAAELTPEALALLHRGVAQLDLSLRAYGKLLAIARTLADLGACERVLPLHVAEAVQYRVLDRASAARRLLPRLPEPSQAR